MKKRTDSMQDHIDRQQAGRAAELAAKLALVEIRAKPTYGRAPRKIGEIVVKTGFREGYRDGKVSFVLRLDADKGEFIAEHGDMFYVSKSREALQLKMEIVGKIAIDLVWTRYIAIDYEATTKSTRSWSSEDTLGVSDSRKKRTINGIKLTWQIVEYSGSFAVPGADEDHRFMKREVDENGTPSSTQETVGNLPAGLVAFTPERLAFLQRIVKAFTAIDAKMIALLGGDPDDVGAQLDAAHGMPLVLTDGKPKP